MSLIYSVIARCSESGELTTLCSYDAAHGNYPTITQTILKQAKIPDQISYKYNEEYNYHIVKDGTLILACLAQSSLKLKTAYVFLQEIRKKFRQKYSKEEIAAAKAFDMSSGFSEIYKQQFTFFNSNKDQDKKQVLMKHLQNLQGMMSDNIEKVLQREQKVELMVKKTAKLDSIAQQIRKNATKIKKQAFWARNKCKLLIAAIIVAAATGAFFII